MNVYPMMNQVSLKIQNLSCFYGSTCAVGDLSLNLKPGEHLAIVGANGSGKSTLLRAVMGLHQDWRGVIDIDGVPAAPRARKVNPHLAWMPQRHPKGLFPFTIHELLCCCNDESAAVNAAAELGIDKLLQKPLSELSGGQLQRAFLARLIGELSGGAGLLLADEPTAALDFDGQKQVGTLLTGLQTTMIIVTHDLSLARKCRRIMEMAQGRLRELQP